MNLLVTGGAGFIGSNFIRYWLKNHRKDKIINLDKLTYAGNLSSTKDFSVRKNYTFIKGDIRDAKIVDSLMKQVDVVVNFAAESHVDRAIAGPKLFVLTNVVGTQVLLDAAVKYKIKRFHHVSTDEVFGSLGGQSRAKFTEETPYNPRNPYSASKASSDHLVRVYFHTYGLPVTLTNCSNNFGPYQYPEKFMPRFITNLMDGKRIPVYGDGKYIRDWLYVEDHCRAIDLVLTKGRAGETYLVGGLTQDVTNLEVAIELLKIFSLGKDSLEFVKDRPGHDRRYAVDWSKIKRELGWRPKYEFSEWLAATVDWYKKNEWWWRPLKNKTEKFYKAKQQ